MIDSIDFVSIYFYFRSYIYINIYMNIALHLHNQGNIATEGFLVL